MLIRQKRYPIWPKLYRAVPSNSPGAGGLEIEPSFGKAFYVEIDNEWQHCHYFGGFRYGASMILLLNFSSRLGGTLVLVVLYSAFALKILILSKLFQDGNNKANKG